MRGKQAPKRKIAPDNKYNSVVVSKFINYVMMSGRKTIAREIVYKVVEDVAKKTNTDILVAFEQAIENVKPKVEVRSKRVGGSNLQVPVQVYPERQFALACRWIIDSARNSRKDTEFWESLSREIINAYKKEGSAIKKKEEVQRMAEANKAFAQFA